jgi:hypothetical protein
MDIVSGTNGVGGAKEYQIVLESTSRTQILGLLLKGTHDGVFDIPAGNAILGTGKVE